MSQPSARRATTRRAVALEPTVDSAGSTGVTSGRVRDRRRRRAKGTAPYRAFISYSHAVDGRLAPAIQSALHRFTKPWYQLRSIRVFRDEASLSASPALWASIESALKESEFFILLASPEAAASEWVNREVAWWMANKEPDKLLIVLTGGELAWDSAAGDIDWSTTSALPPALQRSFDDEPRHVDLRWAAHQDHLSMNDPRFRDCVADIAAPLHRRPKDELFGEDVRQHRRAIRLARTAVASLTALALLAMTAATVAVRRQRQATAQARLAISRQLAATATDIVDAQFDLALLMAVEALRTRDTPQARASLFSVLERNPQHVAFLRGTGAAMTVGRITTDGTLLAAGDVGGVVTLWKLPDTTSVGQLRLPSPSAIESLSIARDGSRLAAGGRDGQVVVWDMRDAQGYEAARHADPVRALAFSPDGKRLASGDAKGSVVVTDLTSRSRVATFELSRRRSFEGDLPQVPVRGLAFATEGRDISAAGRGLLMTWDVTTGQMIRQREPSWSPSVTDSIFSDDLSLYAESIGKGGYSLAVTRTDRQRPASSSGQAQDGGSATLLPGDPDLLSFSPDGGVLAVAGEGSIRLFEPEPVRPHENTPVLTGYPNAVTSVSFDGDRRWMAAASGEVLVLSDLTRHHRLGRVVAEPKDVCGTCSGGNTVSISPDGRRLAWLDDGGDMGTRTSPVVRVWDLVDNRESHSFPVDGSDALAFRPDGRSLVTASPISVWDLDGHRLGGPAPPDRDMDVRREVGLAVSFTSSKQGLVLSAVEGRLLVRDVDGGGVRFEGPPADRRPVATISSTGTVALAGEDGSVSLWDAERGGSIAVLPPRPTVAGARSTAVDDLAFDADGGLLAAMSGGTITVWDVAQQRQRFTLRGGSRGTLAFARDGSRVASASQDGNVTVWDLPSGQLVASVKGQSPYNGFPHLTFTPDGAVVASVVPGGGLVLVDMNLTRWRREACAIAGRDLTRAEHGNYAGDLAPRSACT